MFAYLVLATALVATVAADVTPVNTAEASTTTPSSGWTALLGCVWEDDAVGCLREHSARALKELHTAKKEAAATAASAHEHKDDSILEVLHDGTARMIEYLRKDEEQEELAANPEENKAEGEATDSQGRAIEEGRKKIKIGKLGKKGKKGGGLLQTFYMLKMMFGMLISMKLGFLSFLLQVKTFFLSLIFVIITVVQFFWKLQEKKSHGGISFGPPSGGWEGGSSFGGYGPSAQSGGWDKRAWTEQAHRQAYAAQAPAS